MIRNLIHAAAAKYGLNANLVAALIHVESSGNPKAVRFEPYFFDRYLKKPKMLKGKWPLKQTEQTERIFRACSFGLMQVMGNTAREHGFEGESLLDLLDPATNLDVGCRYLAHLMRLKNRNEREALFAYNAGPGSTYPGEKPGDYPSKVLKAMETGIGWDSLS